MNIVFDLDGTLIDAQYPAGAKAALVLGQPAPAHVCGKNLGGLSIYKRPGVDDLLRWCFKNFDNVGMWTLSGEEWVSEVLTHVLPEFPKEKWSFIYCKERATRLTKPRGDLSLDDAVTIRGLVVVKDLKKVYRRKDLRAKGFNRHNTIIVEDTPSNCVRNYGNAIYVSCFDVLTTQGFDRELGKLQKYFERVILGHTNLRFIEKRRWRNEVKSLEEKEKVLQNLQPKPKCFWMAENWSKYLNVHISDGMHKVANCASSVGL